MRLLITLLCFFILSCQNGGNGDSSVFSPKVSSDCTNTGAVGTWLQVGDTDTLTITSNCHASSTKCASQSVIYLTGVSTGCENGGANCWGTCTIGTTISNGNQDCMKAGTTTDCTFAVTTEPNGSISLIYNCGTNQYHYTKQ